jgi:hypothetical protein
VINDCCIIFLVDPTKGSISIGTLVQQLNKLELPINTPSQNGKSQEIPLGEQKQEDMKIGDHVPRCA